MFLPIMGELANSPFGKAIALMSVVYLCLYFVAQLNDPTIQKYKDKFHDLSKFTTANLWFVNIMFLCVMLCDYLNCVSIAHALELLLDLSIVVFYTYIYNRSNEPKLNNL